MTNSYRSTIRLPVTVPLAFAIALLIAVVSFPARAAEVISYSKDIFPIIQIRCLACHQPQGAGFEESGFDLTTYQGLMKGTKFGTMVIPGDAFMSNLMVLIEGRAAPEIRMPHGKRKMSSCDRDLFRRWINQGAKNN